MTKIKLFFSFADICKPYYFDIRILNNSKIVYRYTLVVSGIRFITSYLSTVDTSCHVVRISAFKYHVHFYTSAILSITYTILVYVMIFVLNIKKIYIDLNFRAVHVFSEKSVNIYIIFTDISATVCRIRDVNVISEKK